MHFTLWDTPEFLGARVRMLRLEYEMSPWAHVLKAWSPAAGAILGGARNFTGWVLAEVDPWSHVLNYILPWLLPVPFLILTYHKQLRIPWCYRPTVMGPTDSGRKPRKSGAHIGHRFMMDDSVRSCPSDKPSGWQWATLSLSTRSP